MEKIIEAGSTPYDDVFRTLVVDHRRMLLAFINEMFPNLPDKYHGDERVVPLSEHYMMNRQNGEQDKRIIDSAVMVIAHNGDERIFHVESQSTNDGSMIIRMFEYDMQIALKTAGEYTNGRLRVEIPQSGVLFLRCNENTPDEMSVELALPDGKEVSYSMPILKMIEYDADTLFNKELYLIAPFYLFNLEHYFKNEKEMSEEDQKAFTEELKKFKQNLDKARDDKKLDDYAYRSILDLFNKVAVAITEGKEEVYRETEAIMGGQVLEYEAKTILNQGKAETKNEDIKSLAEYFVKETPTLSYEDAVKMAESILNK